MIDRPEFVKAWTHLCARFGRENDAQQAAAYFEFLTEQLDTEQFLRAARAIWATAKWFPRPADFLLLEAAGEWSTVLEAVEAYTPPHGNWTEPWQQLTERSRDACRMIGGVSTMRTIYDRGDVIRLKTEWEKAYEQSTTEAVLALPAPESRRLAPA